MRPWVAHMVGIGASATALAVGLWAGSSDASATGSSQPVPLAQGRAADAEPEVPLGRSMTIWGQPTHLSIFRTSDPTERVLQVYLEAWKSLGEPKVVRLGLLSSVSVVEPETGLLRTVTVQDLGQERVVIPGVTDIRVPIDLTDRDAPVPVPENATLFHGQAADDVTSVSYHASFVAPMSARTTLEFYRRELAASGYKEERSELGSSADTAAFSRGPEHLDVVVSASEEGGKKASFVIVQHVRQIEGGAR